MPLSPPVVFNEFDRYLSKFTVAMDDDIEDQFFDRKEIRKDASGSVPSGDMGRIRKAIKETVSAFANTNPEGGLLVVGISKDGVVVGIDHLTDSQRNSISRISDLLRNQGKTPKLEWSQVNLTNRTILLYRPKVDNETVLVMTDKVFDVLSRRAQRPQSRRYVFTGRNGQAREYSGAAIRKAIRRTGLGPDVTPHVIRHTVATRLLESGLNIQEVQHIMGHADQSTACCRGA